MVGGGGVVTPVGQKPAPATAAIVAAVTLISHPAGLALDAEALRETLRELDAHLGRAAEQLTPRLAEAAGMDPVGRRDWVDAWDFARADVRELVELLARIGG